MVFERNLNGIEVILRIDNYESPSKHTFGDWWCDCGFSFRMGKLAEIINYRKDHDELLTPEEVDGLEGHAGEAVGFHKTGELSGLLNGAGQRQDAAAGL